MPVNRVLTTRPDYSQKYSGLELTATKRMSHKWMFRGNLTYNNYTESCGANAFADPTAALPGSTVVSGGPGHCPGGEVAPQSAGSGAFGNDFISAKWNVNLTGAYIMPWDINLGASLSARQGYPRPFRSNVSGLPGGTIGVVLDPIGDIRFDNVYELDLRIAKDFRFMNRVGMTLSGDLFNAPNKRTILQRETLAHQRMPLRGDEASRGGRRQPHRRDAVAAHLETRREVQLLSLNVQPSTERPAGASPAGRFCFTPSPKVC